MGRDGISKFIYQHMAQPDLGEVERGNVNQALIHNQIGVGPFIKQFEEGWAKQNGYGFGVSCNSGTNAIALAIRAVEARHIAIPNFTMSGTAWAAIYKDCEITYIPTRSDIPLAEYDFDMTGLDTVVYAHIYGRRAYPVGWIKKAREKYPNVLFIDDMAEAHGIIPEGDIACYSFYGNKILTTGEGGMCLTNNEFLAEEMKSLANMYFDKDRSMIHPKVGYNFRMTNLQAAVGCGQIERLEEFLHKRSLIEGWYDHYLPEKVKMPSREVVWFYDIKLRNAEKTRKRLKAVGIESRRFFYPMSLQPWGNQMPDENGLRWYKHGLLLPVHVSMIEADVKNIVETLKV